MGARHITKIEYVRGIDTPARVSRDTGVMQINPDVWNRLNPDAQRFITLHEEGHLALQTSNEFAVDEYAFKRYVQEGRSLKGAVHSLTDVLSGKNWEHADRAHAILRLAMAYDRRQNNFSNQSNSFMNPVDVIQARTMQSSIQDSYDSLFGKKNKEKRAEKKATRTARKERRKEARTQRKEVRVQRKQARVERKNTRTNSKAAARQTRAAAKLNLSEQGISEGGQAMGAVADIVGSIFNKGGGEAVPQVADDVQQAINNGSQPLVAQSLGAMNAGDEPGPGAYMADETGSRQSGTNWSASLNLGNKKNTPKWLVPAAGAVVAIIVLILLFKKKK